MFQIEQSPTRSRSLAASRRPLLALCVALSFNACAGDVVSLGEEELEQPPIEEPRRDASCGYDGPLSGEIMVKNQAELDALEGCSVIDGDLYVVAFEGADLHPLHELTAVEGYMQLGSDPYEVNGTAVARIDALVDAGWLTSLEGLESLERVGSLYISGLSAPDVAPLAGLRGLSEGFFRLDNCPALRDLSGLENLRGADHVELDCENLENIAALHLPRTMQSLTLAGAALEDLGSLGVQSVSNVLSISAGALRDLDGLASLRAVRGALVISGAALTDMSGLDGLEVVGTLVVRDNPVLTEMAEFPALGRVSGLIVYDNPRLEHVSEFPALYADLRDPGSPSSLTARDELAFRPDLIEVVGNPRLRSFAIPSGWRSGAHVVVSNNAQLASVDFQLAASIDRLSIENNLVLSNVSLGALARVGELNVVDNPQLLPATFDAIQTFERQMSGNATP